MKATNIGFIIFAIISHSYGLKIDKLIKDGVKDLLNTVKDGVNSICPVVQGDGCPEDLTYWLYTRSTQDNPTRLDMNALDRAPWGEGPLKFIVHGYSVHKDTADNAVLRPAYFAAGEYNIVSVDWSPLGKQGCYLQAKQNVQPMAKCVGEFFNAVTRAHQFSDVHLLGHSMGAHVAAWASTHIQDLPRLTKFDVAYPLFEEGDTTRGSARFIDVYHSNCGLKGQSRASGDVDVYFNNNVFQPGCKCDTSCSHLRAVEYFAESIRGSMKGFSCQGWEDCMNDNYIQPLADQLVVVGDRVGINTRGSFMVYTNSQPPFLQEDNIYTDTNAFNNFRDNLPKECDAHYTYQNLIGDWIN